MNIIDENFNEKKQKKSGKKAIKIIVILMIILLIAIIGIIITLSQIEKSTLKLYIDGKRFDNVRDMLVYEGETIYVPIRNISGYLGYESYNGDYIEKSEEKNKCYVSGPNEIATFLLNSNKIYKKETTSQNDYQYFYSKKPVKSINGELYISSDGIEKAFNISFNDNRENNQINIYTMSYLIKSYSKKVLDLGYAEISNTFNNQKSIFDNRLIVESSQNQNNPPKGIIDLKGNIIAETKYDDITYLPQIGDFLVTNDRKVGIMTKEGKMKILIRYDDIKLMDKDAGLFLVKNDNKYGILDIKGNKKIDTEYDQIGVEISKFSNNNIKNKYLLINKLIPIKKNKKWGMVDKDGNKIVDFIYDDFGYIATSNKDAMNLLVIPEYDVIVTRIKNKYGLINQSGEEILKTTTDDMYMTIESNIKNYYFNFSDNKYNLIKYLDEIGVKINKNNY